MAKRMLIDATQPEETRVAVLEGNRLENFDLESAAKKQLKGNIYLAKVTRVEPSLQAAFVNYGGNRHGFLPFSEIHPDYYRIPVADRERLMAAEAEALAHSHDEDEFDDTDEEAPAEPVDADAAEEGEDTAEPVEAGNAEDTAEDAAEETTEKPKRGRGSRGGARRPRAKKKPTTAALENPPEEIVDQQPESVGGLDDEDDYEVAPMWRQIRKAYKIQEVIKRGQIMLIQVTKEERGNKGAAVTSYITMPGRYCVLMPNSPQSGGVSRKISNHKDRRKMKDMLDDLRVPDGMSVILRTAGLERTKTEVKRDLDYLMRLWDAVRETTLQSTAPALIHEEGSLIKRAIRDLYDRDTDEIVVEGEEGYRQARDFMKMMMPSHVRRVKQFKDTVPLFFHAKVEPQIDAIHSHIVQLKSGGYLVINPTEALVSIDVNSGRATRERHIEETALKTNLEAAEEVARQLRLRDLGGLIVIDFIDMENRRNNSAVEKKLRDALSSDRARIQVGRISNFGLLELSRQRLRPSLTETHFRTCPHCRGLGMTRTVDSEALLVIRAIETAGIDGRTAEMLVHVTNETAMFIFNHKRHVLHTLEERYAMTVSFKVEHIIEEEAGYKIESLRTRRPGDRPVVARSEQPVIEEDDDYVPEEEELLEEEQPTQSRRDNNRDGNRQDGERRHGRDRNRNRNRRDGNRDGERDDNGGERQQGEGQPGDREPRLDENGEERPGRRRRRRGRRGGRNRNRGEEGQNGAPRENGEGDFDARDNDARDSAGEDADTQDNFVSDATGQSARKPAFTGTEGEEVSQEGDVSQGGRRRRERGGRNRGGRNRGEGRDAAPQADAGREQRTPAQAAPVAAPAIEAPAPVRERAAPKAVENAPQHVDQPAPPARDYETVNASTGEKKKGWWGRLVN